MARAMLLALTCAAAASAARYADYSGVKMPAYGAGDYEAPREPAAAPAEDYRGHSPDAPASPDYKYEEEPRVKTEKPGKDSDEPDVWRKQGRKQRGLMRPPIDSAADTARKYERDEDDVPKYRSSHRYPKHRSRLKPEPSGDEPPRRAKYSRDRKDDVSDIDSKDYFHVDKDDFPDDKSKDFDEENKFVNEATTRRARRKSKERFMKRKNNDQDFAYDDDEVLDQRTKADEELAGLRRMRPMDVPDPRARFPHPPQVPHFRPLPDDEEDEQVRVQPLAKPKHKPYEDYDDYYDMKRVNSIKNKLPQLLRRLTTERAPPKPTSYLDMLWTNRRLLPTHTDSEATLGDTTRLFSPRPKTPGPTTTSKVAQHTRTAKPSTTKSSTNASTTTASTTKINAAALSLAEKSRLSILKKDARKEGQHVSASTAKPAVLMQVTQFIPTVVMVEPPSSMHPYIRLHELAEDPPRRLEKVKKLMRQKLVAESKSMHELTSNWDEMVCDYIDTSLLDTETKSAAPHAPRTRPATSAVLNACLLYMFVCF